MKEFKYWIAKSLKFKRALQLYLTNKIIANKFKGEKITLTEDHLAELLDTMQEIEYPLSIKMTKLQ